MARANDTPVQTSLSELMNRYLRRTADAQAAGLASAEPAGDVVPFEAAPVQIVDPRVAWNEAIAAVRHFDSNVDTQTWKAPPEWPPLVAAQEPTVALAFCLGNYPQLVRHLQPLLRGDELAPLRPSAARPIHAPELVTWADEVGSRKSFPQVLLALGALRLARQFTAADALLEKIRPSAPVQWRAALANEEAALNWHRGEAKTAYEQWQEQTESVPVLFNRGMAALFLDRPTEARSSLAQAIAQLPEAGAWHHLGRLYLALAEMR